MGSTKAGKLNLPVGPFIAIDPGSKSTGWAQVDAKGNIESGTITAEGPSWDRLGDVFTSYYRAFTEGSLIPHNPVYIERLVRMTHIITHYSVAAIGIACQQWGCEVYAEISIKSWQKAVDWNGARKPLQKYKDKVKSEDELAAIGMAIYLLVEREKQNAGK